jgi:hypothetical protein
MAFFFFLGFSSTMSGASSTGRSASSSSRSGREESSAPSKKSRLSHESHKTSGASNSDPKSFKVASNDTATVETTPFARPYSALMASLFSPPQPETSVEAAAATATSSAAPVSSYSVPPAFDPHCYNTPDIQSVMVHSVSSTEKGFGFQAVIVLHPQSILPSHLGLPRSYSVTTSPSASSASLDAVADPSVRSSSRSQDDGTAVHLMTSAPNHHFVAYHHAPRSQVLQININEYLTLLTFWSNEWSRLQSRLLNQTDLMRKGQDQVSISSTLSFYHHGSSHYVISLSSRLALKFKADSRESNKEECIRAWLECQVDRPRGSPPATASAHEAPNGRGGVQVFVLPVRALSELVQDTSSLNTLTNLVSNYKNRSIRKSRPV